MEDSMRDPIIFSKAPGFYLHFYYYYCYYNIIQNSHAELVKNNWKNSYDNRESRNYVDRKTTAVL